MPKVDQLIKQLEETYNREKEKECEELHNKIVDVLNETKPNLQNALYILDLIKFELLKKNSDQLKRGENAL